MRDTFSLPSPVFIKDVITLTLNNEVRRDGMIMSTLDFFSSLAWPIVVLIVFLILRSPIINLLKRIKTVKWKDITFEIGDTVPVYSPEDNQTYSLPLQPIQSIDIKQKPKVERLSDDEIEKSRQRAVQRLKEDTERVGYQRGKLFQLDNGKWAISWEIE
jgi:hypothetical protein